MSTESPAWVALCLVGGLAGCSGGLPSASEQIESAAQATTGADAAAPTSGSSDVVLTWSGPSNVFPATLGETPSENYDADFCEFFVNGFGQGNFSEDGATVNWLEAYVSVAPQQGTLLAVAMYTRSQDSDGVHDYITLGSSIAPSYWKTGFTTYSSALGAVGPQTHTVIDFAFFIDVERADGEVVRLWQSDHGANYMASEVFALPPSNVVSSGAGATTYASNESDVFYQKLACE